MQRSSDTLSDRCERCHSVISKDHMGSTEPPPSPLLYLILLSNKISRLDRSPTWNVQALMLPRATKSGVVCRSRKSLHRLVASGNPGGCGYRLRRIWLLQNVSPHPCSRNSLIS